MNNFEVTKNSSKYIIQFFQNRDKPGRQFYLKQRHTELEIVYITSGRAKFLINHHIEYSINPGDIFLFSSNEDHYTPIIYPGEDMTSMGVHFRPQFILSHDNNDLFDSKYLRAFLNRSEGFKHKLEPDNPATEKIRKLICQIKDEFENALPDYMHMVKILLLTILVEIDRSYNYKSEAPQISVRSQHVAQIEKSIQYIDRHIDNEITLDTLVAEASMSRSYYCQLFKSLNGMSPWDYIISKRIELAKRLLVSTDDSILDIVYKCGFNNSTNFNRAFKKVTGTVPSEFRKYWRSKGTSGLQE